VAVVVVEGGGCSAAPARNIFAPGFRSLRSPGTKVSIRHHDFLLASFIFQRQRPTVHGGNCLFHIGIGHGAGRRQVPRTMTLASLAHGLGKNVDLDRAFAAIGAVLSTADMLVRISPTACGRTTGSRQIPGLLNPARDLQERTC
jgi:hypothetical protein